MNVAALQRALLARGFNPGPLDGAIGPRTIAAIKAFQRSRGLEADGIAGPKTSAALLADLPGARPSTATEPPWWSEARRWMDLEEIAGAKSEPVIVRWGQAIADWYRNDDTPWCGAFVHGVLAAALPDEPRPANALWARSWAGFGIPLPAPALGAILVFERGATSGHVGFYAGEDAKTYHVLGGNQSNKVSIARIDRARLLRGGIRWPASASPPLGGRVLREAKASGAANPPLSLAALSETSGRDSAAASEPSASNRRTSMNETKSIFASRGVWGAAVAVLATGLGFAGLPIAADQQADLAELLTQGVALAGSAVALWGRISAKSRLRL